MQEKNKNQMPQTLFTLEHRLPPDLWFRKGNHGSMRNVLLACCQHKLT